MKKRLHLLAIFLLPILVNAQDGVLIDYSGGTRDNSAVLDVRSTNQGMLVPRLSTGQRTAIASPANGLLVYDTSDNELYYYDSSIPDWVAVATGSGITDVTADNGLSSSGGITPEITLGGTLNQNTSITQDGNNLTFELNGTGDFEVEGNSGSALFIQEDGTVGINNNSPDATAILDIVSNEKGLLIPRLTNPQRNAISSPANSLIIYNTTSRCLEIYTDNAWQSFYCSCPVLDPLQDIVGPDPVCSGSTVSFSVPGVTGAATYDWTVSGVPTGSITGNGSTTISFPAPNATTFTLDVTASNACNNSSSSQTATVNAYTAVPPTPTAVSAPSAICEGESYNFSIVNDLGINGTTSIDYTWTVTTTGSASATLTANSQTAVAGSPVTYTSTSTAVTLDVETTGSGDITVAVVGNNTCGASTTPLSWTFPVSLLSAAPTSATASSNTICNGQSTTLTLNGGGGGTSETIRWYTSSCGGTLVGSGNGISVSPTSTTTYYGRYETPAPCSDNTICRSVTITVDQLSVAPTGITGTTTICDGSSTTLTLAGGFAGTGATAEWFSGSCGGTVIGTGNSISVSPTSNTTYFVRYNGACNTTTCASALVTVDQFTTAATGPDQALCTATATLAANSPTTGGGTWSVVSGSGTFSSATDPNSGVSGLSIGSNVFRWTTPNGVCTDSQDDVTITRESFSTAPTSISGPSGICDGSSATLSAVGGSLGTGGVIEWFTGSCGGTPAGTGTSISVTPTSNTTYYVRYSGNCNTTACASISVTVDQFTASNAGPDQTLCATSATLAGNAPTTGQGAWTVISGSGTFTDANDPTTTVSGLSTGANVFRWTLPNGGCANSQDEVTINSQSFSTAPTGVSGTTTICNGSSTSLTVSGGSAGTGAVAEWFTGSCGSTAIGTGNSISVSPSSNTVYYVRYSGACNTTTCASTSITVDEFTSATAGIDQTVCATSTSLAANSPTTGQGTWTVVSGSGSFANANDPTTNVTGLAVGVNRFRWTLPNGVCTNSQDDVIITRQVPSVAPTGISGTTTICTGGNTTLTVTGGTLGTGGSAEWYTGSCGGTAVGTGSSITVNPTSTTTYFVRYTSACNTTTCTSVTVTVNSLSTAPTGASGTTTICSGSNTTLTVSGGAAGTGATAQWFTGSCGSTSAGIGNSITVSPASTTTYYVRYSGTCNTTTCATVTVTVNSLSSAPTAISGNSSICAGESTTLTLSGGSAGTGATAQWFTGSCGGTSAGTGSSITVSPSSNTTYYVRYGGTCNTTGCASLTVNVTPVPADPGFGSNQWVTTGYNGGTIALNGSRRGYYTRSSQSFNTLNDWGTTSNPSAASGWSGCDVTNDFHNVVSRRQGFTCGEYRLDVPNHDDHMRVYVNGTQVWEQVPCCGTHTGIWTGLLDASSTIEVRHNEGVGGSNQSLTLVQLSGNSTAPTGITGNTNITVGSSTTLTVSGGSAGAGAVARWYTSSCGGTLVGTGNSITVSPTSNTTYYVRYEGSCNTTSCASATVTVSTTCTHSIVLYDTWGDGWNGGFITVFVNGVNIGSVTLSSGAGPATAFFDAATGDAIQIQYTAGSFCGENYYSVRDGNNNSLVINRFPCGLGAWNGTGGCP